MASPRLAKFALIAAVAASMLMYEILLTRICALRLFFHFAFLVISNCLLGIAASGALITLYQDSWRQREPELLLRFSLLYMASLVVVYAVLLVYALPLALTLSNPSHFVQFSLFNLIGAIPFFCGGLVVGIVLSFNADIVNRLYGADLIGAALGCFSLPFLLAWGGAGGTMVAIVLLALVGVVAAVPVERRRPALVVGALLAAGGFAIFPTLDARFPVPVKSFVELSRNVDANTAAPPLWSAWSTNSRIDVLRARPASSRFIFGRGSKLGGMPPIPEQHVIMQDGSAGTFIVNFGEHPEALEIIERSLYSAAVHLRPGSDVFIIGAGGGNDLWAAKAAGAKRIKAVELNEPILRVHREVFPHYTRPLLEDPNVEIVIDEGRSALMQDEHRYGVLQMTGIDTWTALSSGAYVLAENYLYTIEAIVEMLEHLEDGGILQITRFAREMEALRMVSNLEGAFEALGRGHLERSLIALETGDGLMAFLVKRGAYEPAEIAKAKRFAARNGIGIVYLPGAATGSFVEEFVLHPDKRAFVADFPRNITATTDDRPYFFNFTRWSSPLASRELVREPTMISQGNPAFILAQLALSLVLSAILILYPAYRMRGLPTRGAGRFLLYFASLGLGFILIEIAVLQKLVLFLGHPVYSITVTLFCVLLFTGIGSIAFADKLALDDRRAWVVPIGLAVLLAAFVALSPWLVRHAIGLPLAVRIAISVAALAPLGLLLGIPFSYGIRILDARSPALIPWGWAINGCFSVVGSILAVVVSMNFGFGVVMAVAAVVYAGGFWALRSEVSS